MNERDAVRADFEHRCLQGLGEAAAALAGEDPAVVCGTFERWEAERRRPWPWLAGMCWAALEPFGIAFPDGDRHAVVAGRLLVGSETDPLAVSAAIEALRNRPSPAAPPKGSRNTDSQAVIQHRRLCAAVDAYWAAFMRAARRLHEHVREGDRAGADDLVVATRRRLEELADRLAHLADSSLVLVSAGDRPGRTVGGGLPSTVLVDGEFTGALVVPESVAARPRPTRRPAGRPGGKPRRPGDGFHSYARTREHRYASVVFVVAVVAAALYQLVRIASG